MQEAHVANQFGLSTTLNRVYQGPPQNPESGDERLYLSHNIGMHKHCFQHVEKSILPLGSGKAGYSTYDH